jgi:hypothetical protein
MCIAFSSPASSSASASTSSLNISPWVRMLDDGDDAASVRLHYLGSHLEVHHSHLRLRPIVPAGCVKLPSHIAPGIVSV